MNARIVFMGSPAFAVPGLKALVEAGYEVAAVVTQPDRPAGRGGRMRPPEVKIAAEELGLPVLQPETLRDEGFQGELAALAPDVIAVAAYGKILPKAVLSIPSKGPVNVHASLLPRWRGASPIAAAILAGDGETGVTIMEMATKMDAGAILSQRSVAIGPTDTTGSLEGELAAIGARLLVETLPAWMAGRLTATPQDESRVTYCGLVKKEDGELQATLTAEEAERAVRACNPWPGASVGYREQRLAIWAAHVEGGVGEPPGTLVRVGRRPAVAFAGGLLVLDQVQRTGSKRMSGEQFLNGERGQLAASATLR